jgi:hypothetical protein
LAHVPGPSQTGRSTAIRPLWVYSIEGRYARHVRPGAIISDPVERYERWFLYVGHVPSPIFGGVSIRKEKDTSNRNIAQARFERHNTAEQISLVRIHGIQVRTIRDASGRDA